MALSAVAKESPLFDLVEAMGRSETDRHFADFLDFLRESVPA